MTLSMERRGAGPLLSTLELRLEVLQDQLRVFLSINKWEGRAASLFTYHRGPPY